MEIRLAKPEDAAKLSDYFCRNEHHFRAWEPIRERDYYSEISLTERLAAYDALHRSGTAAHFVGVMDTDIVAHCSLTNVVLRTTKGLFHGLRGCQKP